MTPQQAARELAPVRSPLLPGYLAALAHPDALRRTHAPAHLTASAVVLDARGTAALLVLHRKVGLWLQPGGHVDDADPSLAAAALREVVEETGLSGAVDPVPVALDRHAAPCGVEEHLDVQFLLTVPAVAEPGGSAESLAVRWWPVDALPRQRVDLTPLVTAGRRRLADAEDRPAGEHPPPSTGRGTPAAPG